MPSRPIRNIPLFYHIKHKFPKTALRPIGRSILQYGFNPSSLCDYLMTKGKKILSDPLTCKVIGKPTGLPATT